MRIKDEETFSHSNVFIPANITKEKFIQSMFIIVIQKLNVAILNLFNTYFKSILLSHLERLKNTEYHQ